MAAAERPEPVAQGDLEETPLAHALLYVWRHSLSGTLAVWPPPNGVEAQPGGQDRLLFSNGHPVAARFLRSAPSLDVGLLALFDRVSGPYAFYEADYVGSGAGVLTGRVSPLQLVTAGCRRVERAEAVDGVLRRFGTLKLRIRSGADLAAYGFNADERGFLELVQADPTSADALLDGWGDRAVARRVLYVLALSRAVEVYEPRLTGAPPARRSGLPPPRPSKISTRIASPAQPVPPAPQAPALRPSEPPETEPLDDDIPTEELPVSPSDLRPEDLDPPPRERVAPPPPRAPSVLDSDDVAAARSRSPTRSASGGPTGPSGAPRELASSGRPLPSMPEPTPGLPPPEWALWSELVDHVKDIDRKNYFEMLGVPSNASDTQIRERYFELVKQFHPDRLGAALSPIKPHAQRFFQHITEAKETLSDPQKRKRYERQVAQGGGTPETDRQISNVLQAANLLRKAEVLARRRAWPETLELADEALALHAGDPDTYALKAWVMLQRDSGSRTLDVEAILGLLDQALDIDPDHERSHYIRGLLFKRQGQDPYALWHFQKVVAINRRHLDAMREVRLAEMRGVKAKKPTASRAKALTSRIPPPPPPPSGGLEQTSPGGLLARFFGPKKK